MPPLRTPTQTMPAGSASPLRKSWPNVPPEKSFWVHNGPVLRNLTELPLALERMGEETFRHHVNEKKNDFANWIEFVIGERALADEVRRLRARQDIIRAVRGRL